MASMQASLIESGTSKSGWPIEKLIGSFIFAARSKTLRMPLESKALVRSARRAIVNRRERRKSTRTKNHVYRFNTEAQRHKGTEKSKSVLYSSVSFASL